MYFSVSGFSFEAIWVGRVLVVAACHRSVGLNFVRFEGSRVAGLSLEGSSSDWWVGLLESCVRCSIFHLFRRELASVGSTALEFRRVRGILFGWGGIKPLRLSFIGQVILLVLALPFKLSLGWLIPTFIRQWPLLLDPIGLVVGLITALYDLRVVMRLHYQLLLPLPSLLGQLIRPVKLTIGGPCLKLDALLRTAMLA